MGEKKKEQSEIFSFFLRSKKQKHFFLSRRIFAEKLLSSPEKLQKLSSSDAEADADQLNF